jgi:putative glutamine amidotransferase
MLIGITDTYNTKFDLYVSWLHKVAKGADIVKLSHRTKNVKEVKQCEGVVLTGGHDIHPRYYGREDYLALAVDVDEKRDEFELQVVQDALKKKIPLLGICRGMQLFNVALGGSLIPDIARAGHKNHGKTKEGKDRRHKIVIAQGTTLHWIVESAKGEVNSSHHQAVDAIAGGLRVAATSPDGIVEALEWTESAAKPFLQLVQWHPERMEDFSNPCSKNLLEHFVLAVVSKAED